MGLKVQGFGATRAELTKTLEPIERELELISKTPLDGGDVPSSKKELRQRADVLDRQIEVLSRHAESPDPKVRDSAQALLEVAKRERLRLEDGLLAWMVDDLAKASPKSERREPITTPEVAAVTALLGGVVTDAEVHHAMETLAPLAGQNLTDAYFSPKVAETSALFDDMRKKTSPAALKVAGLRVGPAIGGFLATSAVRSLGGPPALAFFTAALAIRMGITSGKYLANDEIQRVRFETGMNRLEGEVDHDLARIAERAASGKPFAKKTGADLSRAIADEASLVEYLVTRRRETWADRSVPAEETRAVTAFEAYAKALRGADDETKLGAARQTVKRATTGIALGALPSLPELVPHAVDTAKTGAAFAELMAEYGRILLGASNPPLFRLVHELGASAGAPDASQLAYLKKLVGAEPSLGEVLALAPLFASGKVDAKALWTGDAAVSLPDGSRLDQATVSSLLAGLGSRDDAERSRWWGKVMHAAAPFVGSLLGAGVMAFAPAAGLLVLGGAVAGTLIGEKASHAAGEYLAGRGTTERVTSGVDVAPAIDVEYSLGLDAVMRSKDVTSGGATQVAARLADEAAAITGMLGAVERHQARIAAHRANLAPGADADALDHLLALHTELKAPIYGRLGEAAAVMSEAAARGGTVDALRATFAGARASVYELMPAMVLDVLVSQASPELSLAHGLYFRAKRAAAEAIAGGAKDDVLAKVATELADAYAAIPKKLRPDDDALDAWAKAAKKDPEKLGDRAAVTKLVGGDYLDALEGARAEALSVGDKRAKQIGQEVVNALWTQVYGSFGLHDGAKVPELSSVRIERQPIPEAEGFSHVKLRGKLEGGGRLELVLDALGQPSADLSTLHIDLGERHLGRFVGEAAVRHVAAMTGEAPALGKVKLLERTDDGYVFAVRVGERTLKATIGADGLVEPSFLQS